VKFRLAYRRVSILLTFLVLLFGIPATVSASSAATSNGWISLGNLSATPSPVDMYLYSSGESSPQTVFHDVAYGTVLPFRPVNAGDYSVQVRPAGSSASSKPVLSVSVPVQADRSYTVAPLSTTAQGGQLKVIDDSLTAPAGKSLVRVIQASINQKQVTFHCSCASGAPGNITSNAAPGSVSSYAAIPPGNWTMTATGSSAKTSLPVPLVPGTVHTEVVIDQSSGIEIVNLLDAAGPGQPPAGGVDTGLGGTAPHGPGSPLPWLAIIGAGMLLTLVSGVRLRRNRLRRPATGV
jgi:Domain of unknown function (DUF4397)